MLGEFNGFLVMNKQRSLDCSLLCCKALRKQLEHSRGEAKLSTTSCVFPLTSFLFYPPPACFPTEQSTVNASLFVNF